MYTVIINTKLIGDQSTTINIVKISANRNPNQSLYRMTTAM